jgi:Fic family protein
LSRLVDIIVSQFESIVKFNRIFFYKIGNGRVGRLIMAYQAIQNNIIPPLIKNEHKDDLCEFLYESIQNSLELIEL